MKYLLFLLIGIQNILAIVPYTSQYGQDAYVYEHFFKNKRNGVFVDIGAHNGIAFSNTYFFEKELDWTGICFEPLPEVFEECTKNRSCICLNVCVASEAGRVPFIRAQGYTQMLSGMRDTYHALHLERLQREIACYGGAYEIIEVPACRLNDVLKEHGFLVIDFLSIDTEGSEEAIIRSIDFDLFKIHVIAVENNYQDMNIKPFLESRGFRQVIFLGDDIYVNSQWENKNE